MRAPSARLDEVDALRGLCALGVLFYHYVFRFDALVGFSGAPNPAYDIARAGDLKYWGMLPVYIFFVISGFVITMTLSNVRTVRDFAWSRFSRIFPAYWVSVTVTYLAWQLFPVFEHEISGVQFLVNLTMVQEFFHVPSVDGVYWSLTAELSFYVAIGCLYATGRFAGLLRPFCIAWVCSSLMYAAMKDALPLPYVAVLALNLKHAHLFVAGIVFHEMWAGRGKSIDWAILAACAVAVLIHYPLGPASVLLVVFGAWILFARFHVRLAPPRWLLFLGAISYSLYLTHQMIGYQFLAVLPLPVPLRIAAVTVIAVAVAAAITYGIERPAQRALRAWRKRQSANALAGQSTIPA